MFQWFRTPLTLTQDLGSVPSIQIRRLTTTCKSRSMDSDTLSGLTGHYTHMHRHTHRHIAQTEIKYISLEKCINTFVEPYKLV